MRSIVVLCGTKSGKEFLVFFKVLMITVDMKTEYIECCHTAWSDLLCSRMIRYVTLQSTPAELMMAAFFEGHASLVNKPSRSIIISGPRRVL